MAGIGFELRRAIREGGRARRSGAWFSAAFTCFGGMLIGILLLIMIQTAAAAKGMNRSVSDLFMSYVTNTMFLSMLVSSILSMVLSRYVSDMMFEGRYEAVMPSVTGGAICSLTGGGALYIAILAISKVPMTDAILLYLLFDALSLCWLLMSYISLLRDYKQITFAFLFSLFVSGMAILFLSATHLMTITGMIAVLVIAYTLVDAWLFRAVYKGFPVCNGSPFAFIPWIRQHPALVGVSLMLEIGILGHFWMTWFCSDKGTVLQGLFSCCFTYDFPAIVAYFSTIPAMIYFITTFETGFYETYHEYLHQLNDGGRTKDVDSARERMIQCIQAGMRNFAVIQIVSCMLFITVGSLLLSVMNIGMTETMLQVFRMFCVGYSLYAIGNVLLLLQMYFINERAAAVTASIFACLVLLLTFVDIQWNGYATGVGLSMGAFVLSIIAAIQTERCLDKLEYHILYQCQTSEPAPCTKHVPVMSYRHQHISVRQRAIIGLSFAVCAMMILIPAATMLHHAVDTSRVLMFEPEQSSDVLLSPGMGYAPWANSDEAEEMQTTLVYVELRWADWEPEKGVYNLDYVNDEYRLQTYREQGRQVVFRFICDEPTRSDHIDIPDWLYQETKGDGYHYRTSYGTGYSPNYSNAVFIEAHAKAIAALGEAFGKDDFFHYVELGSLGHWGEYHVNHDEGVPALPYYDTRIEYIKPYLSAFPTAHFMTRYPLLETVKFGCGLYNDMTGDPTETKYWLEQMSGGIWEQTGLPEQADTTDTWKNHPVGGEFASTSSDNFYLHDNLSVTLELLKDSHQSFIGPKVIVNETDTDYSFASSAILKAIGYRYSVSKVRIDLSGEESFTLDVTMTNSGVAPVYDPYTIRLSLYDDEANEVWCMDSDEVDLTKLLPGEEQTITAVVETGQLDDDMQYTMTVSVCNHEGRASLPLALNDIWADKTYVLASFRLDE